MNKHVKELKEYHDKQQNSGYLDKYTVEKLEEYVQGLFRFSKFKIGDRVQLKYTPIINDKQAWGWLGYKDMLVRGAKATVKEIDYRSGDFRYGLIFDQEPDGMFTFGEKELKSGKK